MERTQVLDLMAVLKLYGMRQAYDEVMAISIKRQHEPPHIVGVLLKAEIAEKQARSIRYQFIFRKLSDGSEVARGQVAAVCAAVEKPGGKLTAVAIPEEILAQITVAPPELLGTSKS